MHSVLSAYELLLNHWNWQYSGLINHSPETINIAFYILQLNLQIGKFDIHQVLWIFNVVFIFKEFNAIVSEFRCCCNSLFDAYCKEKITKAYALVSKEKITVSSANITAKVQGCRRMRTVRNVTKEDLVNFFEVPLVPAVVVRVV